MGIEISCEDKSALSREAWLELIRVGQFSLRPGGEVKYIAAIPCQVEGDTITVPSFELPTSDTWLYSNHPPGSEIEVKKGEKCSACGRGEE